MSDGRIDLLWAGILALLLVNWIVTALNRIARAIEKLKEPTDAE